MAWSVRLVCLLFLGTFPFRSLIFCDVDAGLTQNYGIRKKKNLTGAQVLFFRFMIWCSFRSLNLGQHGFIEEQEFDFWCKNILGDLLALKVAHF